MIAKRSYSLDNGPHRAPALLTQMHHAHGVHIQLWLQPQPTFQSFKHGTSSLDCLSQLIINESKYLLITQ